MSSTDEIPLSGTSLKLDEILEKLNEMYPGKPFCVIRDWTAMHIESNEDDKLRILAGTGIRPTIISSGKTIYDSRHRWSHGESIKPSSGLLIEGSTDRTFFETKSTVYVLAGRGKIINRKVSEN